MVPTFDLSKFLIENFKVEDEVILKIDIEGAEYYVIEKMLNDGAFRLVDKFYLEFHPWQPIGWTKSEKKALTNRMKHEKIDYLLWEAEYPIVNEVEKLEPALFQNFQPLLKCQSDQKGTVKLAIAVGLNPEKSERLISTVLNHYSTRNINIGIFIYRDFLLTSSNLVEKWLNDTRVVLGIRGDSPKPRGYYLGNLYKPEHEMMIFSTMRRLVDTFGFSTRNFLRDFDGNSVLERVLSGLNMNVVQSTIWVPPHDVELLDPLYFTQPSIHKIPKLLQSAYNGIWKTIKRRRSEVPTLVLDSDFDETWTVSGFLLDYFASTHAVDNNLKLTNFKHCT